MAYEDGLTGWNTVAAVVETKVGKGVQELEDKVLSALESVWDKLAEQDSALAKLSAGPLSSPSPEQKWTEVVKRSKAKSRPTDHGDKPIPAPVQTKLAGKIPL